MKCNEWIYPSVSVKTYRCSAKVGKKTHDLLVAAATCGQHKTINIGDVRETENERELQRVNNIVL